MHYLFEHGDLLNSPYEVFLFDSYIHNFPVRQHWHYYMEFLFITQGEVLATCGEQSFHMTVGDMICFPPKSLHGIFSDYKGQIQYYVLKFDLGRFQENADLMTKLRSIILEAGTQKESPIYFTKKMLADYPFESFFRSLAIEYKNKDYGFHASMHAIIAYLLLCTVRIWRELGFKPSDQVNQPEDNALDTITQYIDAHSNQPILVEDLASKCNMSYSFFAKKFKQLYGRSCKEYIEYVRVTKAEDLLLFTDNDLTFISQETGFSDSSHMIKTFKKYKGITPKQFRMQNTKKLG